MELRTHRSIRDLGEAAWRGLLPADAPPFLCFEWLDALEQTGCVRPERGWMPAHISIRNGDRIVAAAPAYVKGNSEGEFVFDHGWARFAQGRLGLDYYPKLIVAVPFTPATGPRLLVLPGEEREPLFEVFAEGLRRLCTDLELSSAHVLFPTDEDASLLERAGLSRRAGLQFHWHNAEYTSFDDFLCRFSSKRRHQIRRERRELELGGTTIEHLSGSDLVPSLIEPIFSFYSSTVHKYYWGRQYLNRAFFEQVLSTMPERLHVVLARDRGSKRPIACAFNLLGQHALYGRYWGACEERPFLHFNVCYYAGIEFCIARGLSLFEPGAGGEHKLARGFLPTITHSAHHLADRRLEAAVCEFVAQEREALRAHVAGEISPLASRGSSRNRAS